jgi:hypothetical protein
VRSKKKFNIAKAKRYPTEHGTRDAIRMIQPGDVVEYHKREAGPGLCLKMTDDQESTFAVAREVQERGVAICAQYANDEHIRYLVIGIGEQTARRIKSL